MLVPFLKSKRFTMIFLYFSGESYFCSSMITNLGKYDVISYQLKLKIGFSFVSQGYRFIKTVWYCSIKKLRKKCSRNPNLIVRLSKSYYSYYYYCSVTLRVPPLSRERKELSETRWCQNNRIFKGFSVTCVGHTAWAAEGREGRSQEAWRASN